MIIIVLILYIIMAVGDTITLYRAKRKKEIIIHYSIMLISLTVTILLLLDVKFLSVAEIIRRILEPIVNLQA